MSSATSIYHGVVRGKTIELDCATGLPDGQDVTVAIQPATPGAGIQATAGAWADAGPELDQWLEQINLMRR